MTTVEEELQTVPSEPAPSFEFRTPSTVSFPEFIHGRREGRLKREAEQPEYAVPVDNDIRRTLGVIPFGHRVDDLLERVVQIQLGPTLHNGVRVSPRQFPHLYSVLDTCANRLGIAVPRLIVVPDVRMSAGTAGTNENYFILVTSALIEKSTDDELRFLIGHECGHIHCRHLTYLALARVIMEWTSNLDALASRHLSQPLRWALQVPMASWQRKAELTCDRAGLICCRNLEAGLRALAKHIVQAPELADKLDLEEYVKQIEAAADESTLSKLPEFLAAFPFVPKRMAALKLFARSALYFDLTGQDKVQPDLLSREDLEKRTDRVTSIL
jgi:Zn-dependent protease with chaperone function